MKKHLKKELSEALSALQPAAKALGYKIAGYEDDDGVCALVVRDAGGNENVLNVRASSTTCIIAEFCQLVGNVELGLLHEIRGLIRGDLAAKICKEVDFDHQPKAMPSQNLDSIISELRLLTITQPTIGDIGRDHVQEAMESLTKAKAVAEEMEGKR